MNKPKDLPGITETTVIEIAVSFMQFMTGLQHLLIEKYQNYPYAIACFGVAIIFFPTTKAPTWMRMLVLFLSYMVLSKINGA